MAKPQHVTVLLNDPAETAETSPTLSLIRKTSDSELREARILLVFSTLSRLDDVAQVVRDANRSHRLKGLIIRSDVDPVWTPVLLDRANVRTLRNLLVHHGDEVPTRVLEAWAAGAQKRLIADATIVGDRLLVVGCDFSRIDLALADIPPLRKVPDSERAQFEIDEDGSFIWWPIPDVHLDRRALRAYADPDFRNELELKRLARDRRFGHAVRTLRLRARLTQTEIPGVSARHLRRIEQGHRPRLATLEKLSLAVGMTLRHFLNALANETRSQSRQSKDRAAT